MFEVIKRLKYIADSKGEDAFIDSCKVQQGHYFLFNGSKINYYNLTVKNYKDTISPEVLKKIKSYKFYEGFINANKAVCISNDKTVTKKILNVTPYAIIMKFEHFAGEYFQHIVESYLSVLKTDYDYQTLDIDEMVAEFMSVREFALGELHEAKVKASDKIVIFKEMPIENYRIAYNKYLDKKIFLRDNLTLDIDGQKYGPPSFSFSLDENKKTLSVNPYGICSNQMSLKEAKLMHMISKINEEDLIQLLNDDNLYKDEVCKLQINIRNNPSTKNMEIGNYNIYTTNKSANVFDYYEYNLLSSDFVNEETVLNKNITRNDLLKIIDIRINAILHLQQESKNTNVKFLLSNIINYSIDDFKAKSKELLNANILTDFISCKNDFILYFKEEADINIFLQIKKILLNINKFTIKKYENTARYKYYNYFDAIISLLNFLNPKGGYGLMVQDIKRIWDKLNDFVLNKKDDYTIETDGEFFFLAGQIIRCLTSYSNANDINGTLIEDALNAKNVEEVKKVIINKYSRYKHNIPLNYKTFNILYANVMGYNLENKNISLKEKLEFYYQAGLIGNNFKFISKKNKDSEGENENEEK